MGGQGEEREGVTRAGSLTNEDSEAKFLKEKESTICNYLGGPRLRRKAIP